MKSLLGFIAALCILVNTPVIENVDYTTASLFPSSNNRLIPTDIQKPIAGRYEIICKQYRHICREIITISKREGIDPFLTTAIIRVESVGKINARNKRSGSLGLMQIHPVHWKGKYTANQVKNPSFNIKMGLKILKDSLRVRKNSLSWALSGYNTGVNSKYYNRKYSNFIIVFRHKLNRGQTV